MKSPNIDAFHTLSRNLDYRILLESLLSEFRIGHFADPSRSMEAAAIDGHLGDLYETWDRLFPGFPTTFWKRRSLMWEYDRGRRDAHLQQLLVSHVDDGALGSRLIVNPATVFGRHAMSLAWELPEYEVVGTDIDGGSYRLYRLVKSLKYPHLPNFHFEMENVFDPDLERRPKAVTFFGACGAVTDGCMDYAVGVEAPFLLCRSCCHENIGGNTEIMRRPTPMSWGFYLKNRGMAWIKSRYPGTGFYFSDRHKPEAYPRSKTAREMMDTDTMIEVARNSVESDICRSIIDLDRCLLLQEKGYDVLYREELFFAHKRV